MIARGHGCNALRRFATSKTMIVLGLLVAFLLPLHGIEEAVGSILSPAHYHSRVQRGDVSSPDAPSTDIHTHSSGVNHTEKREPATPSHGHEHDAAVSLQDQSDEIEQHSLPHRQPADRDTPAAHFEDHHDVAHQGQPGASIGHHAHALNAADVVYVDDDSGSPERSAASTTTSPNADTILPGWWMASMPAIGAQILPEPCCDFDALPAAPHMRPPSAATLHT